MERLIAIFGMIIGVIGFYFVVSNINSIISNSIKRNMNFTSKITLLSNLRDKYKLKPKFYKMVRESLINEDYKEDITNFTPMLNKFPRYLQRELKYNMYLKIFGNFNLLRRLEKNILNAIGDKVKQVHFQESKHNKTKLSTKETTLPKTCTSSKKVMSL
jgi:hypothetical protein